MDKSFRRAQWKFIVCSMIAYVFFYLTRKNLSMAQPLMLDEGVISKYALGLIMTVHGVLSGETTREDLAAYRGTPPALVVDTFDCVDGYALR